MNATIHDTQRPLDDILKNLQEREKELNCLYRVEKILNTVDSVEDALTAIIRVIPAGWQYSKCCCIRILHHDDEYRSSAFQMTPWKQSAPITVDGELAGEIQVIYIEEVPQGPEGPFLPEEQTLLNNIADRVGKYIFHQHSERLLNEWRLAKHHLSQQSKTEWQVIIDLLQQTDQDLFLYVTRKLLYHLCWNGIQEAQDLLEHFGTHQKLKQSTGAEESNKPSPKVHVDMLTITQNVFRIASAFLDDDVLLSNVQGWIRENKTNFLVRSLDSRDSSMGDMVDAIRHFYHVAAQASGLSVSTQQIVNVSLLLGFFSDQLDFIRIAKEYIGINDMYHLLKNMIYSVRGRGRIGGKGAGLFLASQIIKKMSTDYADLRNIRIPKTWYITSNEIFKFALFNNLEEIVEQKYKPIELIRIEYPHITQIFKNSPFPPEMLNGLSRALDDFGEHPLIVRSSSLLEDRLGTAFSGKYKSLFLANQGTKEERLEALTDAIAEVYASTFGPDPLEYRAENGLLDFHEEMGIMLQEVVGTRIDNYFLPSYAGVAFSNNEFRWSPRIQREDGLIRLVPGLGTRAVDRLADDYPVLIAPGKPGLRVNATVEDCLHYAPKYVDVINLATNSFETIEFDSLVKQNGDRVPAMAQILSVLEHGQLSSPGFMTDFSKETCVVTFEGLRTQSRFVEQIRTMLHVLEEKMHTPVDIEFASDGTHLYLLQCRSQSSFQFDEIPPIPKDIDQDRIVFTAQEYVSNADINGITHIVYVDPLAYSKLPEHRDLFQVGRVVSRLNKILPKRQFILMGPGRWGSRGDIKLGVHVTYSDINNTAVLIEMAMAKGEYVPELSFGTHFFQDLVESSIHYLPLYPGSEGTIFNRKFLTGSPNILAQMLPEYAWLNETIKVIDIPACSEGMALHLVMNAELNEALAYLDEAVDEQKSPTPTKRYARRPAEDFWRWRLKMATHIASQLDPERFGVEGFYVIGSAQNATAGPQSDIDLLLHVRGTTAQQNALRTWLEGWSLCLSEMNYQKTGYRTDKMLDIHFVTDQDIEERSSFAIKIDAVTDAARQLPMKPESP
ncbi:pyruvate, phosphate dikinase [candidate division KSB3 bacterium]|uniref:Pyruvate, phosphate dikinase n=1 Tax=candidate division KSB3 bacterium TaxID=2044937 RepID=A0A2G6K9S0_9BACT|nr:MAG: pyruvate, phosphate dikinase [candidate division KSB3 bacterium]